jgi:hypothetical protein
MCVSPAAPVRALAEQRVVAPLAVSVVLPPPLLSARSELLLPALSALLLLALPLLLLPPAIFYGGRTAMGAGWGKTLLLC